VHVRGDRGRSKHGWYALHVEGWNTWGAYGSWKTGEKFGWRYKTKWSEKKVCRVEMHPQAKSALPRPSVDIAAYWESAGPADPWHPYLVRKGVHALGLRQRSGSLLVPLRNAQEELLGIQCISEVGRKRFLRGSKPSGAFHLIGLPGNLLLVVEGYADGASCHAVSGLPVAIAFGAGNLLAVGIRLTLAYPLSRLIFIADDDSDAPRNIGLIKATEAAGACYGAVIPASRLMEGG